MVKIRKHATQISAVRKLLLQPHDRIMILIRNIFYSIGAHAENTHLHIGKSPCKPTPSKDGNLSPLFTNTDATAEKHFNVWSGKTAPLTD